MENYWKSHKGAILLSCKKMFARNAAYRYINMHRLSWNQWVSGILHPMLEYLHPLQWRASSGMNCHASKTKAKVRIMCQKLNKELIMLFLLYRTQTAHIFTNKKLWVNPMNNLLTSDFAESQVKNLVKKGGSLPSITVKIGVSRERFSIRKLSTINFWWSNENGSERKKKNKI